MLAESIVVDGACPKLTSLKSDRLRSAKALKRTEKLLQKSAIVVQLFPRKVIPNFQKVI